MNDIDLLQRFIFENKAIRGEIVRLHSSYLAVLSKHDYPLPVRKLLGEALAIAALMSSMLKSEGSVTLQIQATGPITLIVAQVNHLNQLRGLAHWQGDVDTTSLKSAFGTGHLVITIDPGQGGERWQGIVELTGNNLAEAFVNYFQQSEQIDTFLFLASDDNTVAGIRLQALPQPMDKNKDTEFSNLDIDSLSAAWESVVHLTSTLTTAEILQLSNQDILRRLFLNLGEDIRVFEGERFSFYCNCSRERMESAISLLSEEEMLEILQEKNVVTVTCEFCNQHYEFDSIDVALLFRDTIVTTSSTTKH